MSEKTIVDASLPNAGRIYDYLLGGHHNFEIDRRAGDQLIQVMGQVLQSRGSRVRFDRRT